MKTMLSIAILASMVSTNGAAAIVANPVHTIVEDNIDSVKVTSFKISEDKMKVVVMGQHSYENSCKAFDKKLKLKKTTPGEIRYEVFGYNYLNKYCNDKDNEETRKYQIDSFVWDVDEKIPDIYVNKKLIN